MEEKPDDLVWRGFRGFRNTNRSVSWKRKMEKEKTRSISTMAQQRTSGRASTSPEEARSIMMREREFSGQWCGTAMSMRQLSPDG